MDNEDINNEDINNEDINNDNIKQIIILEESRTKKIQFEKEIKLRVETKTWGLKEEELNYDTQIKCLQLIKNNDSKDTYTSTLISHIKSKLSSYRQQDILKNILNAHEFVSFEETINLLTDCNLICCYCSNNVYILYEKVREMKQWSLDRINNHLGHNHGNLVIACLECNLKRRRTNKDAFMFTKKLKIIKKI